METVLYPFKFTPIYKEKIWGGQKIKNVLKHDVGDLPNCGEAWLISGVDGEPTEVCNGELAGNELNELVEVFMGDLVGESVFDKYGEQFPLLIKILDSNDWLSVQVHPNDELAEKMDIGSGKTEMWYVMQADDDAELIAGFRETTTEESFREALKNNNINRELQRTGVKTGDTFFIPSGRIHALGPGCLVAEIQQTSDNTFRVYDWDRIDQYGMMRPLHIDQALEALDYETLPDYRQHYANVENKTTELVDCPHFTTNIINLNAELKKDYSELDSFVILFCVEGAFTLSWEKGTEFVKAGECLLVPNIIKKVNIRAEKQCKILETYIIEQQ